MADSEDQEIARPSGSRIAEHSGEERERARGAERATVIYVMGAGRSGSTILGVALGNCTGVFFAGELDKWLARSGVPRRTDAELAAFWSGVRAEVVQEAGKGIEELFGGISGRLERSSALVNVRKWRGRRRLRTRYRIACEQLYLAVRNATGASQIVDTSHYPLRANQLRRLSHVDFHLLYLVRDPHSVVASLGRRDVPERTFNLLAANAYLWLTHLFAVWVFLRQPRDRRVFVRHEDFIEDPRGVLSGILGIAGSTASVPDLDSLLTGVPFHGNRLVSSRAVSLNREPEEPPHSSLVTSILQLPWRVVFSRLRPVAPASRSRS